MLRFAVPSLIERLSSAAAAQPSVRLAVLFGSAARTEGRTGRDIDVGVLLSDSSHQARVSAEAALGRAAGQPIDLVYLHDASPLLRFEVARDGRLILERAPHFWADFRARAMIDWWEWAPVAGRLEEAALRRLRRHMPW